MNGKAKVQDPFEGLFEDASARALSRVGVVDVGSNSIRLVIFDGAARSPAYFYNEKVMAGLGKDMAATGKLNPEGVERAFEALSRFAVIADENETDMRQTQQDILNLNRLISNLIQPGICALIPVKLFRHQHTVGKMV